MGNFLSQGQKSSLCYAHVITHFNYCSLVWHFGSLKNIHIIIIIISFIHRDKKNDNKMGYRIQVKNSARDNELVLSIDFEVYHKNRVRQALEYPKIPIDRLLDSCIGNVFHPQVLHNCCINDLLWECGSICPTQSASNVSSDITLRIGLGSLSCGLLPSAEG